MLDINPLNLELKDTSWPYIKTTHERNIVRAIVFDSEHNFYFENPSRDDEFGKLNFIETSGGGVEKDESLEVAIRRELKEELGFEVTILAYLGLVKDQYNLIYRTNLNNYFLCKVLSKGEKHLTLDEKNIYHLKTLKLTYQEAINFYNKNKDTRLGSLLYAREVPILDYALKVIKDNNL